MPAPQESVNIGKLKKPLALENRQLLLRILVQQLLGNPETIRLMYQNHYTQRTMSGIAKPIASKRTNIRISSKITDSKLCKTTRHGEKF